MNRTCIVCGKSEMYDYHRGWRNIMLPFGRGYSGWEEYAFVCSGECENICGHNAKQIKKYLCDVNKYPDGTTKYRS